MSLISVNKFDQYAAIIREIEENDGEVTEKNAEDLIEVKRSIAASIDSTVRYRKYLKDSISKYKEAIKDFVGTQEKKLERLDDFIKWTLEFTGDLKTPFSSLKIQTRKTRKVIIDDFDLALKTFAGAATINTFDNVRTIRINKDELLSLYDQGLNPVGFSVIENETKFIDAREKTKKERQNAVTEGENT